MARFIDFDEDRGEIKQVEMITPKQKAAIIRMKLELKSIGYGENHRYLDKMTKKEASAYISELTGKIKQKRFSSRYQKANRSGGLYQWYDNNVDCDKWPEGYPEG